MKSYIFVLCLFCFTRSFCQNDTLKVGFPQIDTLLGDTIQCYPYCAPVRKCHKYQLQPNYEGYLEIAAFPADIYELYVTTYDDTVRYDVCDSIVPFAQGATSVPFSFGPNTQVTICGQDSAMIFIAAKPDTVTEHRFVPDLHPILELDTLCNGTTPIIDPIKETPEKFYYELEEVKKAGMTGIRPKVIAAEDRKPDVAYIRAKTLFIQ